MIWLLRIGIVAVASLMGAHAAFAESQLFLSPSSGTFPVNEAFPVTVYLDTGGESVNAAEGTITFNAEELEVADIDISRSIFSMWFIAPTSSVKNRQGIIKFSGAVPAGEHYKGNNGALMVVSFKALRPVSSEVWFSQGAAVLAADGRGSNVLSSLRSGTYTLTERQIASAVQLVEANASPAPKLTSPTHPNQETWYATTSATINVLLPSKAVDMKWSVSTDATDPPTGKIVPKMDHLVFPDITEGTSYVHVQYSTAEGWSKTAHYKLNIDDSTPTITSFIEAPRGGDETDPRVSFSVEASDTGSNIAWYEFRIDDRPPEVLGELAGGVYRPSVPLSPSGHTIELLVRDHAGNAATSTLTFKVGELEPPTIQSLPEKVMAEEQIVASGTTYPNADLEIRVTNEEGVVETVKGKSNEDGHFSAVVSESAKKGTYLVAIAATDERGAKSSFTPDRTVVVSVPMILLFGTVALSYLSVFVPLFAILAVLIFVLVRLFKGSRRYRRSVLKETNDAETKIKESFESMRAALEKQRRILAQTQNKRDLTPEEARLFGSVKTELQKVEEAILAEVGDLHHPEAAPTRGPVTLKETPGERRTEIVVTRA